MIFFMRKSLCIVLFSLSILSNFSRCGMNTDTPVAPFVFFVPVGVPQIFNLRPSTSNVNENLQVTGFEANAKPEYILTYFVTNREPQFVGYNLYIGASIPSVAETLAGEYLEDGIAPSFPHLPIEASTENNRLVTRKIKNFVPPPGLVPFQRCQIYTFSMRAFLNSGVISNQSTPVSVCSSVNPKACPVGSGCNPEICTQPNCGSRESCPVGTECNPCNYPGTEEIGCPCPENVDPPGCYR
ncbi:MAG: hypothetical protein JJT78_02885 [Leptospira sp.]|nr:hypothetical protein [Leptospira sp.]